jgi:hypothetical protein
MVVLQSIESLNKGDLDSYLKLYDNNVILHGVQGVEPGIDSVRVPSRICESFSGCEISVDDLISKADKVVR